MIHLKLLMNMKDTFKYKSYEYLLKYWLFFSFRVLIGKVTIKFLVKVLWKGYKMYTQNNNMMKARTFFTMYENASFFLNL